MTEPVLHPAKVSSFGVVLLLAISSAVACTESLPAPLDAAARKSGLDARPSNTTCVAPNVASGRVRLQPAFEGFRRPLAMVDRPERGLTYVAEMAGRVKVIDRATGAVSVALDLVGKVGTYFEQGLLGLAVHPTKPYAYVTVERDADATTLKDLPFRAEILRFTIAEGGRTFDPASEKVVLRVDRPSTLHYPGTLEFGPDGMLYIGVGDGGRDVPVYPTDSLLGSILRIDVDKAEPYAIPPDNPFAGGGGRPEIYAGGFRNPWRFTFDRATGDLWAGDVGDTAFEEVNKVERGKNYGWPTLEGNACFRPKEGCDPSGLTPPAYVYGHSEGASVTGGYVYRGKAMPELVGQYIFGDYTVGRIWALEGAPGAMKAVYLNLGGAKPSMSSFGEDADGEIYALDWESGTIFKLVAGEPDARPTFATLLSQTGCVDPADPKKPAAGLVPYGVNNELWSDGAEKHRFIAIPDGTTLHVEDDGDLTPPERSVSVKTFAINGKLIETRLLARHTGDEWSGATYEWNDEQTDAVLLDAAKEKPLANGQIWAFPSPAQCFVCHKKASRISLGIESQQLNGDYRYAPGRTANQLATLSEIGFLDRPVDPLSAPRLPGLTSSAPLEDRARAYLHANCSGCHRSDAGTGARIDLRYGLPRLAMAGCQPSTFPGVENAMILAPGEPQRSAIFLRLTSRTDYQMPPLGTHMVDELAASVVGDWIRSLDKCD